MAPPRRHVDHDGVPPERRKVKTSTTHHSLETYVEPASTWTVKRGEVVSLGGLWLEGHGLPKGSETLGLTSRVRWAAPSLPMLTEEPVAASYSPTKTVTLTMLEHEELGAPREVDRQRREARLGRGGPGEATGRSHRGAQAELAGGGKSGGCEGGGGSPGCRPARCTPCRARAAAAGRRDPPRSRHACMWPNACSEIGILRVASHQSQACSVRSEVLRLSSRLRRAASGLQMHSHEPLVASCGTAKTPL